MKNPEKKEKAQKKPNPGGFLGVLLGFGFQWVFFRTSSAE